MPTLERVLGCQRAGYSTYRKDALNASLKGHETNSKAKDGMHHIIQILMLRQSDEIKAMKKSSVEQSPRVQTRGGSKVLIANNTKNLDSL